MTKHPVTRWYRLAIAAVVPLVLTVCYTPPDAIDSISDLGNVEVDVPSTTALAAAEPAPPVRPEMAAVDPCPTVPAPNRPGRGRRPSPRSLSRWRRIIR